MLYLFHGNNLAESRKKLGELVNELDKGAALRLDKEELSMPRFKEACAARGLFAERSLVIVEVEKISDIDFLKKEENLTWLEEVPAHTDVVFWVGESIHSKSKILKRIKELGDVYYFKKDQDKPFDFLDALAKKDPQKSYLELANLRAQEEHPLKLIQLIAWELRTLISVKSSPQNPGLHPFVYKKSKKFARNFSQAELINLFAEVMEADLEMKTGGEDRLVIDLLVDKILE